MGDQTTGATSAQAFLSYTHSDDKNDSGQIVRLAERIASEFRALTGDSLDVFIDQFKLRWGDDWEQKLAGAVEGTTFLLPVVTPSYFKSPACREELLSFSAQSRKAKAPQLVMPIYWIDVEELSANGSKASDEAMALVARHQWLDLRDVRLADETSSEYRKAVNAAAKELVRRIQDLDADDDRAGEDSPPDGGGGGSAPGGRGQSGPQSSPPVETKEVGATSPEPRVTDPFDQIENEALGFLEHLEAMEDEIPRLLKTTETLGAEIVAMGSVFDEIHVDENSTAKERLILATQTASKIQPHAVRFEELGQAFASSVVTIDPGVLLLLDPPGDSDPEDTAEFARSVVDMHESTSEALMGGGAEFVETVRGLSKLSRSFNEPARRIEAGYRGMLDGQRRIDVWAERARARLGTSA